MPIVIDSPNQQAQDDINMPKVLKFIAHSLPGEMQLIMGSETDTDYIFDNKIELNEPYSVLKEDAFEEVNATLEPLLMKMYEDLD